VKCHCAECPTHACYTKGVNCTGAPTEEIRDSYTEDEKKIMQAAAFVEATYYNKLTRLEETAEFAKQMGYKKIGMTFCIGLQEEAKYISRYFSQFFEVYSVCCKNCSFAKTEFGLKQVDPNKEHEAMCNPKYQAKFLNEQGVEFFVSIGLCVGHDSIFNANCNGPVTVLVAKDRVLAHNPLGAVYSRYWQKKLKINDPDKV